MKDERVLSSELGVALSLLENIATRPRDYYRYERRLLGKKRRLLRIPRNPLREILDAIRSKVLDPMPLPSTIHGWRKRHSTKTYSGEHLGQGVIVNADIQDFFPSVGAGRVYGFWLSAGYSPGAAKLLTKLTTLDNQLPQGSPTSQSIGNQILRHMERRLSSLARKNGLRLGFYGDEVALSGRRRAERLEGLVLRIIKQEGFIANPDKIKVMPRDQRQELAGNVVNKKVGPGRDAYRELRAIVHNCCRYGWETQNRERHPAFREHLRGRIAQVQHFNPRLGAQLLSEFELIDWTSRKDLSNAAV